MNKIFLKIIISSLFFFTLSFRAYAYDDGDFQIYNTDIQEIRISKDFTAALEEEFHWEDNAGDFYYHHYDAGFFYSLSKFWNFGGGYRHIFAKKNGKFRTEDDGYVTATFLGDYAGFKFDNRGRIENQHFDYQSDAWRYRNKFTLKFPWKITNMEIQPYVADETFFRFGRIGEFNQNRFFSGFAMNLTKNIKSEIYYIFVSSKSGDRWIDANVLGTKLKIAF